jgi:hypothetical protein
MKDKFIKHTGFQHFHDKKSLISQLLTIGKENIEFNPAHQAVIIKAFDEYQNYQRKKKTKIADGFQLIPMELEEYENKPFYKFISKSIYNDFISKGKFRLGSLKLYREIEDYKARDEREGCVNLIFKMGNRYILSSVISGFNHYIFCGSHSIDNAEVKSNNFGDYIMKISNVKSFAEAVKRAIGAKKWDLKKIIYQDFKASYFEIPMDNELLSSLLNEKFVMTPKFFNLLYESSKTSSLFVKPSYFKPEEELRITFTMEKDVKKFLDFHNQGLLNYIEFIKVKK